MSDVSAARAAYARDVARTAGVRTPRIVEAFATIPREDFLGPPPWSIGGAGPWASTITSDPRDLYQDVLIGLSAERGINNGEPSLHAACLAAVDPRPGETVLQVGAGSGYYTALLAFLVRPGGHVYAYEIEPDLAARARRNLDSVKGVTVQAQSAIGGTLPGADVVYASAGVTHLPPEWLDALTIGGRLLVPLTPDEGGGCMLLVTRTGAGAYAARIFLRVWFIPCVGARDEAASRALAAALARGDGDCVRSLRRHEPPDESAWCIGEGWWLSTRDP